MGFDIVLPENNEAEFIEVALKLGVRKLCFLYDFDQYSEEKTQRKLGATENKKINIEIGFLINKKNMNRAAKFSRLLVAKSADKDRFFIESKKIKIIYGFEASGKKDFIHQRASGLNHILCDLARKNNVAIGFSYSSILNSKNSPVIMGRMTQNISLCKKYKTNIIFASFSGSPYDLRAHHDAASLFKLLGANIKNNF